MAVKSGFFMSVNGDRRYDAAFFAEYFSTFIGNGIFPNPSTNLQVVEGSNMRTIVKAGKAWINGYYLHNDSDLVLQHGVAHGTMKRIDRIVVRWNVLTRQMVIEILKGTNATSPVAPAITRDTNYYDLVLADVYINAGTIQITQANITDQRLNSALCGVVTQTVKTVDTTTLFNQYQSWINQQKANYEAELATWMTAQKDGFASWRNTQQTAFTNWMVAEKAGFDDWSSAQQAAFTNWTATQKGDFESWRNTQQTSFADWMKTEKNGFGSWRDTQRTTFANWRLNEEGNFETWRNSQQAGFSDWMTTEKNVFENWIDVQQTTFENWKATEEGDFGSWRNAQQTSFTDWMAAEKSEFDAWFENLQEVLNGDVVANLQNQITNHVNSRNNPHGVTSQQVNEIAPLLVTVLPSAYPKGVTVFNMPPTETAAWQDALGVTGDNYGTVLTCKGDRNTVTQRITFTPSSNTAESVTYERDSTASNWRNFKKTLSQTDYNALNLEMGKKANKTQEGWIHPVLFNGWTTPSGRVTRYFKDEFGMVHVEGTMQGGTSNTLFTLPQGYRPSVALYESAIVWDSVSAISSGLLMLDTSGTLQITSSPRFKFTIFSFSFRAGN